jgi:hypothetical protein
MSWFECKYELESCKKEDLVRFHKSRRMFAIKDGILYIAPEKADYSHAEWFERINWISKEDDSLMNRIIRGAVYEEEISFYKGYNFEFLGIEQEFFIKLPELAEKLKLNKELRVIGGTRKKFGEKVSIKDFGSIQEILLSFSN